MILAIRTDQAKAEIMLLEADDIAVIDCYSWQADRKLANLLLKKIMSRLDKRSKSLQDLVGIVVFTGEGSFTGLRIGTTVANSLAYSLTIPIVSSSGANWLQDGMKKLTTAKSGEYVAPEYGSAPNITFPKPKT